jgi:hypothetical protein
MKAERQMSSDNKKASKISEWRKSKLYLLCYKNYCIFFFLSQYVSLD